MQYKFSSSAFQFLEDIYSLLMGQDCHSGLDLNCNAGIKGLILTCTDATLHCCQWEWEWGPKEKTKRESTVACKNDFIL